MIVPRYMPMPQVNGYLPAFLGVKDTAVSPDFFSCFLMPSFWMTRTSPHLAFGPNLNIRCTGRPALTLTVEGLYFMSFTVIVACCVCALAFCEDMLWPW